VSAVKCKFNLVLATFGGFLLAMAYVNPYTGTIRLSEFVLQLSGSRGDFALSFSMHELVGFMLRLVPGYVFEIYFGTALYSYFCTASTFVFSRYPNRVRWYFGEILSMAATVYLFQFILLLTALITTGIRYQLQIDTAGIFLFAYHLVIHAMWLYSMALAVNLIAIYHGSGTSFLSVLIVQTICVTLLWALGTMERYYGAFHFRGVWLNFNPMAHLVLGWHGSSLETVGQSLNPPYPGFNFGHSFLFLFVLSAVIVFTGAYLVKNHDLIITDSEAGVS
jgi:hypothetical protein